MLNACLTGDYGRTTPVRRFADTRWFKLDVRRLKFVHLSFYVDSLSADSFQRQPFLFVRIRITFFLVPFLLNFFYAQKLDHMHAHRNCEVHVEGGTVVMDSK